MSIETSTFISDRYDWCPFAYPFLSHLKRNECSDIPGTEKHWVLCSREAKENYWAGYQTPSLVGWVNLVVGSIQSFCHHCQVLPARGRVGPNACPATKCHLLSPSLYAWPSKQLVLGRGGEWFGSGQTLALSCSCISECVIGWVYRMVSVWL